MLEVWVSISIWCLTYCFRSWSLYFVINEIVKVSGNKDPTQVQHIVKECMIIGAQYIFLSNMSVPLGRRGVDIVLFHLRLLMFYMVKVEYSIPECSGSSWGCSFISICSVSSDIFLASKSLVLSLDIWLLSGSLVPRSRFDLAIAHGTAIFLFLAYFLVRHMQGIDRVGKASIP